MDKKEILTVSQVNTLSRTILEQFTIWVVGEVDSYKDGNWSGIYFDLKDENSILPCMFWKNTPVGYFPKNGEKVVLFGTLTLYEKRGSYHMKVSKIEPFGEGELLRKREELRKKLQAEGYFEESIKRAIPELPIKIGIITSARGAVIKDFLANVTKNYEGFEIYISDAVVQGDKAVKSICSSFKELSKLDLDLVVLMRGGGSIEDLMCFNEEEIVKAIRNCPYPVISAVGHEVDYTLADLAADLRVSTPTKAAELISASYLTFRHNIENTFENLEYSFIRKLETDSRELDYFGISLERMWLLFQSLPDDLNSLKERIYISMQRNLETCNSMLDLNLSGLRALSPENVLKRGYSISYNKNGKIVKSVHGVNINEDLEVKFSDGTVSTVVKGKGN